jgi:hypothetical protein
MVIYDRIVGIRDAVGAAFPNGKGIDRHFLGQDVKNRPPHILTA